MPPLERLRAYSLDISNIVRFGWNAPRHAELIWIDPSKCRSAISGRFSGAQKFGEANSGRVLLGEWPIGASLETITPIAACVAHFARGVPWKETGIFEYNNAQHSELAVGLNRVETPEAFFRRPNKYARLDLIFEQIKAEGRIRPRCEIDPPQGRRSKRDLLNFREKSGILIHVGPHGNLFFGGKGCNRFAIALVLGFKKIPAQLGCVHVTAIPYLPQLRTAQSRASQ